MEAKSRRFHKADPIDPKGEPRCRAARGPLAVAAGAMAMGLAVLGCAAPREQPAPVRTDRPHGQTAWSPAPPTPPPARPAPAVQSPVEQHVTIGRTTDGRTIEMTVFGQAGETTLILAGFHGNEPTGTEVARRLVAHLRADPRLVRSRRVAVVAVVNPDGLAQGTRDNAH